MRRRSRALAARRRLLITSRATGLGGFLLAFVCFPCDARIDEAQLDEELEDEEAASSGCVVPGAPHDQDAGPAFWVFQGRGEPSSRLSQLLMGEQEGLGRPSEYEDVVG